MKRSLGILLLGLLALSARANNLVNGDFESGNTGFTTDYLWLPDLSSDGKYVISTTVPNGWAPGFGDHTSGSGNMMVVNASTGTGFTFWSQAIAVTDGDEYTLTGWAATVTGSPFPNLQLKVNGVQVGTFAIADLDDTWQEFSFNWTASGTSATLSLHDLTGSLGGDDFAIDDLSVVPEPASAALLGMGVILLRLLRRYTAK